MLQYHCKIKIDKRYSKGGQRKLNRKKLKKLLDTYNIVWYNVDKLRGEHYTIPLECKGCKSRKASKLKKLLDKYNTVCYTKGTKERGDSLHTKNNIQYCM